METHANVLVIAKEDVPSLHFPHGEVLQTKEEIATRKRNLEYATTLGNAEKNKIYITFMDDKGQKCVHTTIWGLAEANIILKSGTTIPIERIVKVDVL